MRRNEERGNLPLLILTVIVTVVAIAISGWVIFQKVAPFIMAYAPWTFVGIILLVVLLAIMLF